MTTRTLIVMRHGHAAPDSRTGDRGRMLTPHGRDVARDNGCALAAAGHRVDVVLCSAATRTRETWAEVAASLPAGEVRELDALYGAGVEGVLDQLAAVDDDAGCVMVVGHNPTLSELVRYLGTRSELTSPLSPGDTVVLESATAGWDDRRAGRWRAVARIP